MTLIARGKAYRPWLAAAFVAFWVVGTVTAITATGPRGADSEADLIARSSAALRAGDAGAFGEVLLDGADQDFAADYVARVRAAGEPQVRRVGPDAAEIRAGSTATTLSVTEERGRWYLSLLPPSR